MNAPLDTHIILDIANPATWAPLSAFADACDDADQSADIRNRLGAQMQAASEFISTPDIELPNGRIVESFRISKYAMSRGPNDMPVSVASIKPWHSINFYEAREATARAGFRDFTLSQSLALAWDISRQDENWTGGKVGAGEIFKGLHKGTVSEAQAGDYVSTDPAERRWHRLSNGEIIFDFSGNLFQWLVDDIQGDDKGLTTIIEADSITLQAPYPRMTKGMGWRPEGRCDWSGLALVRGGCWYSESYAGVFLLNVVVPDRRNGYVGFRCTNRRFLGSGLGSRRSRDPSRKDI